MASQSYDGMGDVHNLPRMNAYHDTRPNGLTATPCDGRPDDPNGNTRADGSGKAYTRDRGLNFPGLSHCALVRLFS